MTESRGHAVLVPQGVSARDGIHREARAFADFAMTARLDATIEVAGCASLLGPALSLQASLVLSGLKARVTFRDRHAPDDPPARESTIQVPLVVPGEQLQRPRQTVRGTARGRLLTLGLLDGQGQKLGDDRVVGDSRDGVRRVEFPVVVSVRALAWLTSSGWSARGGPRFRLSGKLVFTRGVTARIGCRPREDGRSDEVSSELSLVLPGTLLLFFERVVAEAPPGEPWVWLTFLDQEGSQIGGEQLVGHCVTA